MLAIEDPSDLKRTWYGIGRANTPGKSPYLGGDPDLLRRFFVVASLNAGTCAAIDRTDHSVWYEEDDELHQMDVTFPEMIEIFLREVRDL